VLDVHVHRLESVNEMLVTHDLQMHTWLVHVVMHTFSTASDYSCSAFSGEGNGMNALQHKHNALI
jgi:hypothetical protein